MSEIKFEDFERVALDGFNFPCYYSYKFRSSDLEYEICLEFCFSGFDVAIYRQTNDLPQLVMPKICTCDDGYLNQFPARRKETFLKAIEIANEILIKYVA